MNETKISLSEQEMKMVEDADLILTKNRVIEKAGWLLADLQQVYYMVLQNKEINLPDEIRKSSPKISKGEYYEGLPYLILDYPRYFTRPDIFAIRTMFWWGNFFSITLHLSGIYKNKFIHQIKNDLSILKKNDFHISTGENEWAHHFEKNNYLHLQMMDENFIEQKLNEGSFIKLAKKYPINTWHRVSKMFEKDFRLLTKICSI